MLNKVKKIRDRIFSASNNSGRKDGLYEDGTESGPGVGPNSPKLVTPRSGVRSSREFGEAAELMSSSSIRNRSSNALVPTGRRNSLTLRDTYNTGEGSPLSSPHSGATAHVLPPVQIQSSNNSFTTQNKQQTAVPGVLAGGVPVNLGTLLSPAGANGRRKSTPAALDMALRTAEGKAAVEELLNQGQSKKLVFGNYFAGTQGATKEQQALAKAAAYKQAAGPRAGAGANPNVPQVPRPPNPQALQVSGHSSDKLMRPVPEDEAMEDASSTAQPPVPQKTPADSASSLTENQSVPKAVAPAPPPAPTPPPMSVPAGMSPTAAAIATAAAAPSELAPSGKPTKLLTLSAALPQSMQRKYWCLADYNIVRKMYTGYASTVYQAMCKKSLEMVALKMYHMENLCELNHYQVFREIRVHQSLQHQNIIHLYASFQEGNDVVLVQEYAEGGDLYRLLHKNGGRLSERQAVEMVLHPFLLSLHYLHTRGIMHRDIKPENVLFTEHRVLKLADFGLAIDLTEERAVTRAGTLDYMAPEVLRCPPKNLPQENKNNPYLHYNNSVDAWAVGVFAYELVVGFPPFAGETQLDSVDKIMHAIPEFPERVSELAKDFICQSLRKHPGDRPTVMEMLHHPWIRLYQRRTSMRLSIQARRRSSVVYGSANAAAYTPPQEAAEEGTEGPEPMDTDVNEMTPEQIENMIRKLQVAKQQADMAGMMA